MSKARVPRSSKKRARQEEEEDLCSLSDPEEEDLRSLKVAQLKERCREMGLAVGGNHGVLVERLKEAMKKREEEEEEEEEAYFARYTAFTNRNYEFVIVAAKAVGEENGWFFEADWERTTPEGGWEAKVVQMLEQRYDPNGAAGLVEDQFSPLHHAVRHDHLSMCKILLKHGADPNLWQSCGDCDMGPLHEVKSAAICQLLLDAGAEVNAIGNGGNTALMMAAGRGNARIVRMLLKAGADPTIYDTIGLIGRLFKNEGPLEGETAAKTARRCGHRSLAAELDAAERSHRKKWKPPPPKPMPSTQDYVRQIRENRERLERRMKEYGAPPE